MADFQFNVAKGRIAELARRVDGGDPANSRLLVVAINRGAATDATMRDYDTLAALLGDAAVAEVTNTGYARLTRTAAQVTVTVDNSGDVQNVSIGTLSFGSISAGTAWTDIVVCYIPDGVTPGADSTAIPLTNHTFAVTPDGTSVTATENASGFFGAS
ncbi:hypothetical protein [Prauserella endophytica]|uniref:Baseplate protein J-like domain-containing protein n=1 Tax=Prauserella endophytica TaxID=1592324 RepID=A0ABY2RSS5_9PSEU|nr:hypothetical protein [Prauserella endophytica]TKG58882.1 hypothetical protein FCN18_37335 [Prauserella endophytica]